MAVFKAQISVLVTRNTKNETERLAREDSLVGRATEADVIRTAIEIGLEGLSDLSPEQRVRRYGLIRDGLTQ